MNLAVVIVISALAALVIILRLAVKQRLQTKAAGHQPALRAVDVEAFRTLTNPTEDEYLRRRLPSADFRAVRRARLRAVAGYVQVMGSNAAVLLNLGEAALASGDPRLADAAEQLVNQAWLLRRNTTVVLIRIYVALAWPYSELAAVPVIDRYEKLSSSAMLLGRLQNPASAVRISAGS
jgi:hypothetical protein